jgi:transcriptional regulator with XRE-family HTH domain
MPRFFVDGRQLRNMREDLDISQRELAERLGVNIMTVSRWECGNSSVRISMARRLLKFFKLSLRCDGLLVRLSAGDGEDLRRYRTRKTGGLYDGYVPYDFERLKALRLERLMSVKEVAAFSCLNPATVYRLERPGSEMIRLTTAKKLLWAFSLGKDEASFLLKEGEHESS